MIFRGPLVWVSEPKEADAVAWRMTPDGWDKSPLPGAVCRASRQGESRLPRGQAPLSTRRLWSYSYPYQRRMLARAMAWAASEPPSLSVGAPMCVQASYWTQADKAGRRVVVHLFNNISTTAGHGLPAAEVPLREEAVPIGGIRVGFEHDAPKRVHLEPGGIELPLRREGPATFVEVPSLELHAMVVAEY